MYSLSPYILYIYIYIYIYIYTHIYKHIQTHTKTLCIYDYIFRGESSFCDSHVRNGRDKTGERVYFGGIRRLQVSLQGQTGHQGRAQVIAQKSCRERMVFKWNRFAKAPGEQRWGGMLSLARSSRVALLYFDNAVFILDDVTTSFPCYKLHLSE